MLSNLFLAKREESVYILASLDLVKIPGNRELLLFSS